MPLVSFIVPIYNSERYLIRCLKSILNQPFQDYEIILIDDASTDSTRKICKSYSEKYIKIKYFLNKKNIGVGASRNKGIKNAQGVYIFFVDGDDYLIKNSLDTLSKIINKKDTCQILVCNYISARYQLRDKYNTTKPKDFIFPTKQSNKLYKKSLLKFINGPDSVRTKCWRYFINREFLIKKNIFFLNLNLKIYEDGEFVIRLITSANKIKFLNNPVYFYNDRTYSLSNLNRNKIDFHITVGLFRVIENLFRYYKKNKKYYFKKKFIMEKLNNSQRYFIAHVLLHKDKQEVSNIIKIIRTSEIIKYQYLSKYLKDLILLKVNDDLLNNFKKFKIKLFDDSVGQKISYLKRKKLYIFGSDTIGKSFCALAHLKKIEINGFLDNSFHNQKLMKVKIYSLNKLKKIKVNKILVFLPFRNLDFYKNIKKQLNFLNVKDSQIVKLKNIV